MKKHTAALVFVFLLAWIALCAATIDVFAVEGIGAWHRDFVVPYVAGWLALHGHAADAYLHASMFGLCEKIFGLPGGPWPYPPPALLMVAPLSLMLPKTAIAAYAAAGATLFLFAGLKTVRLPVLWSLGMLACPAALQNLVLGQNGIVTGGLLAGGLALLGRASAPAGLLLGLLVIKPQTAILVPVCILAARDRQAFLSCALSASILCLASIATFGPQPWTNLWHDTMPFMSSDYVDWLASNPASFPVMASPLMAMLTLGVNRVAAQCLQVAFFAACAFLVAVAWSKPTPRPQARLALTLSLSILASPYAMTYDMVGLSLAIAAMVHEQRPRNMGWTDIAVLSGAWLYPGLAMFNKVTDGRPSPVPFLLSGVAYAAWKAMRQQAPAQGEGVLSGTGA